MICVTNRNGCVKLPVIPLSIFDGKLANWRAFYDAFDALIHFNSYLTDGQKLTYLKQSLKGEPHDLINSLDTITANYKIARDLLFKRYCWLQNPHVLATKSVRTHCSPGMPNINKPCATPPIDHPTCDPYVTFFVNSQG